MYVQFGVVVYFKSVNSICYTCYKLTIPMVDLAEPVVLIQGFNNGFALHIVAKQYKIDF